MRSRGYFGPFGGQFVPELLMPALFELESALVEARSDPAFRDQLEALYRDYCGRPTPLYRAANLSRELGGAQIVLKREDLNHTGSHKLNNSLGQVLLAKRMGKGRIIAETGAGQHGVATATACALLDMPCQVYMGTEDVKRQSLNVQRMRLLGAEVIEVESGSRTLKDAINEALRDWIASVRTTHYVIGSVVGPHPFPEMVRDFQSVIGREALSQCRERGYGIPHAIIACVGGGSNAIGIFHVFRSTSAKLIGVEAGGRGSGPGDHAASLGAGEVGIFHGEKSYFLQSKEGQISPVHSIAAGLDYPGVGPEHAFYKESGRAEYVSVTDRQAVAAFRTLARTEGIIPALESAHAVAHAIEMAPRLSEGSLLMVNLSGRGDKDLIQEQILSGGNQGA